MSRYYTDPNTGEQVKLKKTHKFRNFVVLPACGLLAVGIFGAAVSGGGQEPTPTPVKVEQPAPNAPAPAEQQTASATYEAFGTGEAMVSVMDGGHSSNTVQLPHAGELGDGFVTVTVTRSPSMESYMQNGSPDTGEVGCRIIRDGKVVEEQTASGEFASVSCSKFL